MKFKFPLGVDDELGVGTKEKDDATRLFQFYVFY